MQWQQGLKGGINSETFKSSDFSEDKENMDPQRLEAKRQAAFGANKVSNF